jgi:hypothetical protein
MDVFVARVFDFGRDKAPDYLLAREKLTRRERRRLVEMGTVGWEQEGAERVRKLYVPPELSDEFRRYFERAHRKRRES